MFSLLNVFNSSNRLLKTLCIDSSKSNIKYRTVANLPKSVDSSLQAILTALGKASNSAYARLKCLMVLHSLMRNTWDERVLKCLIEISAKPIEMDKNDNKHGVTKSNGNKHDSDVGIITRKLICNIQVYVGDDKIHDLSTPKHNAMSAIGSPGHCVASLTLKQHLLHVGSLAEYLDHYLIRPYKRYLQKLFSAQDSFQFAQKLGAAKIRLVKAKQNSVDDEAHALRQTASSSCQSSPTDQIKQTVLCDQKLPDLNELITTGFQLLNLALQLVHMHPVLARMGRYYPEDEYIVNFFCMLINDISVYELYQCNVAKLIMNKVYKLSNYIKEEAAKNENEFDSLTRSQPGARSKLCPSSGSTKNIYRPFPPRIDPKLISQPAIAGGKSYQFDWTNANMTFQRPQKTDNQVQVDDTEPSRTRLTRPIKIPNMPSIIIQEAESNVSIGSKGQTSFTRAENDEDQVNYEALSKVLIGSPKKSKNSQEDIQNISIVAYPSQKDGCAVSEYHNSPSQEYGLADQNNDSNNRSKYNIHISPIPSYDQCLTTSRQGTPSRYMESKKSKTNSFSSFFLMASKQLLQANTALPPRQKRSSHQKSKKSQMNKSYSSKHRVQNSSKRVPLPLNIELIKSNQLAYLSESQTTANLMYELIRSKYYMKRGQIIEELPRVLILTKADWQIIKKVTEWIDSSNANPIK